MTEAVDDDHVTDQDHTPTESEEGAETPTVERRWSKKSSGKAHTAEIKPVGSEELEKERKRADDLFDRLQRSMADLSNYRKRAEAEREEMAKLASMLLVADLLPVLDNFERALDSIPEELQLFSWLQGIALIERHLRAILERQGVEPIEAAGQPFNPTLHEAIVEEETADAAPGTVVGELQRGYTMHGHVLRPTLAKVAKAPQPAAQTESQPASEESASESVEESR
jgi:molecular chaperone GrpE